MDGNPNEWAVMFHGVSCPQNSYMNTTVLNSIMSGTKKGDMLIAGGGQFYQNHKAVNKINEKVGRGIYCCPHFQSCLEFTMAFEVEERKYRLILQCRGKPTKIKVCEGQESYWVINESRDIRPYGILLIKEEKVSLIKNPTELYGHEYRYSEKPN